MDIPSCNAADATSAKQPAALGDDIDVPFMSCCEFPVQTGTQVTAAPGAEMLTPNPPSELGPRDDHVYGEGGGGVRREWATFISDVTNAATPITLENIPPGAPTVWMR